MLFFALFLLIVRLAEAQSSPPQAHEYIRVVQENGIWWFRDGTGRNFFSLGVNCVGGCYGHAEKTAMISARKTWIVSLLQDWGFNTAACWSSPSVWDDMYVADQLYARFISYANDVFDASFWHGPYADNLRNEVMPFRGKKNFIGYFLDNEPEWKAQRIFEFYLRLGKSKPGSRAFVTYLKMYYQEKISTLNHEWGSSHASFEKIPGTRPPKRYSMHMQQGIILGIRYKGVPDVALFTALSPYFDVNSINDSNRYG